MPKSWYVLLLLRVHALRCNASQCFLLLVCVAAKICPGMCRCHAIRAVHKLCQDDSPLELLQGQQCMRLPLCLCNKCHMCCFQTQLGSQDSGQIAPLELLYSYLVADASPAAAKSLLSSSDLASVLSLYNSGFFGVNDMHDM